MSKMNWHYQLGFKNVGEETLYGVVEVYRNEEDQIMFTTENFVDANDFLDPEDVMKTLSMMREDCGKYPVLNLDTIEYARSSDEQ